MDPLQLEALRFGVAILAGGLVAVISSVLAFRYARRLQQEQQDRHDAALRRALAAEIRENMHRLGGPVITEAPGASSVRVAWDSARGLPLESELGDAISAAYSAAATVDLEVAMITAQREQGDRE